MSKRLMRIDAGIQDLAWITRLSWRALCSKTPHRTCFDQSLPV